IILGATKPTISVKSDLDIISPNADGFKDSVKFSLKVSAFNKIKSWSLKIIRIGPKIERTFAGLGNPPETVSWFGEKDDKKPLPDRQYSYTFEVDDEAGNRVSSLLKPITIDTTKPQIQVVVQPNIFSPNGDGYKDEASFALSYKDKSPAARWKLEIENGKKKVIKKFDGEGSLPVALTWDGKDEDGRTLKDGIYNYLLSAEDTVGNKMITFRQTFKIDNTPPEVRLSADPILFSPNADGEKDTATFLLE
ncbi:unnamed protein product, partial [marine sediment metagenome]